MRKRYPKIENLNQKLKALRVYHHYTQNEIAQILDVDRSTYAYYESGRAEPSLGALKKLSTIYHVSTDFLLDNSDEDNQKYLKINRPKDLK